MAGRQGVPQAVLPLVAVVRGEPPTFAGSATWPDCGSAGPCRRLLAVAAVEAVMALEMALAVGPSAVFESLVQLEEQRR